MDDFIIDYLEGGIDHEYHYDQYLHRGLDIELEDGYVDGPFAASAEAVELVPEYDYYYDDDDDEDHESDSEVEYHAGHLPSPDLGSIDWDEQGVRSESSTLGSIEESESQNHSSDDDGTEEEEVLEQYATRLHHDEAVTDDDFEDFLRDGASSLASEDDEVQHWHPFGALDEIHQELVDQEPSDSTDEEVLDDFTIHRLLGRSHDDVDLDSASGGSDSESPDDEEHSLSNSQDERSSHIYSDDEGSASDDSTGTSRSSSASPSEGPFIPPSPPLPFFPHQPRGFQALQDQIADRQREQSRLQDELRQLRETHFGIPPQRPPRRANAPNGIDYFLDRLPTPQRDAHGLIAQTEMDLERGREQRRRAAPSPDRAPPGSQQEQQQQQPQNDAPAVIDLTGDDSDSEVLALPDAPRFGGRDVNPFAPRDQPRSTNPRRNNPVRRAPSFARSDSSFLGSAAGAAPVIDLTNDAAEPDSPPPRPFPPRRLRRPVDNHRDHEAPPVGRLRANAAWGAANMNALLRQMRMGADLLHNMRLTLGRGGGGGGPAEVEVEFIGENIRRDGQPLAAQDILANFPILENPLANNPVEFNYGANGFNNANAHEPAPRPKPAHIAPPDAREGFTRSTGGDAVVVCPSCELELEYDPDDDGAGRPPPAKKLRTTTKKDREEHHFWAVKACGHVYCRSCYENRRPTQKNGRQTNFEVADKKLLCAVDDCASEVTNKTAWVGIFL